MLKVSISKLCGAGIMSLLVGLSACMEKDLYNPGETESSSLATFATSQDVQFVIQYSVPNGYATDFDIYTENPVTVDASGVVTLRTDITPIAAGIAESGLFSMTKTLPGYAKELYAYSDDLFAPRLMHAAIQNGTATFKAVDLSTMVPQSAAMTSRSTSDLKLDIDFMPTINSKHTPAFDYYAPLPLELYYKVKQAFPNGKRIADNYIAEATMEVKEEAELWISPLVTDCSIINTLGYICYDGRKEDLPANMNEIDAKLITIFPFASLENNPVAHPGATGINTGQMYKLKYYDKAQGKLVDKFPQNTTIVWFLAGGIYDKDTQQIRTNSNRAQNFYYSKSAWNTVEDESLKDHTVYYSMTHDNKRYNFFGFEDTKRTNNIRCDHDFNDMVFVMESSPSTAIVPPVEIDIPEINPVTKKEPRLGILAFEDFWPKAGDYDMNDVVLKYNSVTEYYLEIGSLGTCVVRASDDFDLVHSGADFHNRFSIKYDIDPSMVSTIMVNGQSVSYRPDGTGFIIDVFDDALKHIEAYKPNQSKRFNVTINFVRNRIKQADFQSKVAPYNPFISPKAGVEVHLPMYAPTAEADPSHFGTQSDRSIPAEGIYYVGKEGSKYPFAIHLSGATSFEIPEEGKEIDTTYPRYKNWVESGFSQTYADWYIK